MCGRKKNALLSLVVSLFILVFYSFESVRFVKRVFQQRPPLRIDQAVKYYHFIILTDLIGVKNLYNSIEHERGANGIILVAKEGVVSVSPDCMWYTPM